LKLATAENILTATAGASLRDLMARMGHADTRAALVYLHDTDDRQRTRSGIGAAGRLARSIPIRRSTSRPSTALKRPERSAKVRTHWASGSDPGTPGGTQGQQ
jgi:hypothetical protein